MEVPEGSGMIRVAFESGTFFWVLSANPEVEETEHQTRFNRP